MTPKNAKRQSIAFTSEAMRIVEVNQGRESFNETVNRLIMRAGTVESDQALLYRVKELCERILAMHNAVHEAELVGDVEDSRRAFLANIRNEML